MKQTLRTAEKRCYTADRACHADGDRRSVLQRGTNDYDIVIIGAGPAGSTLARLLSPVFRILLLDGMPEESGLGGKLCGGLLAPDAQKMMAHCSLSLPRDILVDPQIFSVHTVDLATGAARDYPRAYLNVDRNKFDRWLLSLVPPSVTVCKARAKSLRQMDEGWCVTARTPDGQTLDFFTRYLVGAEGANSLLRRTLAPQVPIRTYVAIQEEFPADGTIAPQYACVFDRSTSDCYSWLLCKDGTAVWGGAFAPQGCREAFRRQTERVGICFGPFPSPGLTRACLVRRPRSLREIVPGNDSAFLIGEAAGWISPSSLEGISWAMQSAEILADTLNRYATSAYPKYPEGPGTSGSDVSMHSVPNKTDRCRVSARPPLGKQFRRNLWPMYRRLLLKLCKSPAMYQPFLRRMVMASGIGAMTVRK